MLAQGISDFFKTDANQAQESVESYPVKAMVIDDNDFDRRIIRRCLNEHPNIIHVHDSANGFQALEYIMIHKMRPDLIFLDVAMPVINGPEVMASLRRELEGGSSRVVMMSSLKEADFEQSGVLYGADSFLSKEYAISKMTAALHSYVDAIVNGEGWPDLRRADSSLDYGPAQ